jgi:predicted nucleotidyltransferase
VKVLSFEAIAKTLNEAEVRYLVVGGIAVNAYGYGRATFDVDLVIELTPESVLKAFAALEEIGYLPQAPITAAQFADPEYREKVIEEKNMLVLQFYSDLHRETRLDVFVREPFVFAEEYARSKDRVIAPGCQVRLVSLPSLVKMKEAAMRHKDLEDLENLRLIYEDI